MYKEIDMGPWRKDNSAIHARQCHECLKGGKCVGKKTSSPSPLPRLTRTSTSVRVSEAT